MRKEKHKDKQTSKQADTQSKKAKTQANKHRTKQS